MILSGQTYTVSAGESFDIVSLYVYGDEIYAPYLLMANPELSDMLIFNGGEVLLLPVVDTQNNVNTMIKAPWKE